MKEDLKITASDGSGSFNAFVTYPETDTPAPAVVVIQEIFGINQNMREICANLSQAGYIAICPDLFWRQEPGLQLNDRLDADMQKAFKLFEGFNVNKGVEDLKAALALIRKHEKCSGKTGALGYCLGGKLAYLMATRSDADCAVSYYGVGIEELLEESGSIKKPLLMHMAEKDKFVPLAAQIKILYALNSRPNIKIHLYAGVEHAFARLNGQHYNEKAAHLANAHTADFLATHLGDN